MTSRRGFADTSLEEVDGLADGAVLNELVISAVRDGGAFTSIRSYHGIPQRDIHFTQTFVRSYAQEFEKLIGCENRSMPAKSRFGWQRSIPPDKAADAHRRLEASGTRGRLVIRILTGMTSCQSRSER